MNLPFVVPSFIEIDMSAEIGSYQEDFDPPREPDFVAPETEVKRDARATHAQE